MSNEPTCASCRFWLRWRESSSGACRRFPPQFQVGTSYNRDIEASEVDSTAAFPNTDDDDWCGEFQVKA